MKRHRRQFARYEPNKGHPIAGAAIGAGAGLVVGLLAGALVVFEQLSADQKQTLMTFYQQNPGGQASTSTDPAVAAAWQAEQSHLGSGELVLAASVVGLGYLGYRIGS